MMRFDGNNILIVDGDNSFKRNLGSVLESHGANCSFVANIAEAKTILTSYDFDLVIANYYLADGIIHQLIDWSVSHLRSVPIFTCTGYPLAGAREFVQKQAIAEVFSKTDPEKIIECLSGLLFDFNQFHESLLELIDPQEIRIEVKVGDDTLVVKPIELSEEHLYFSLEKFVRTGSLGILMFSLQMNEQSEHFVIPGYFEARASGEHVFRIHRHYQASWVRFLNLLSTRQVSITDFLNRVAGF